MTLESRRENIRTAKEGQVSAPLATLLNEQAQQDRRAEQELDQDQLASSIWHMVRRGQRAAADAACSPPVLPPFPLLQVREAIPATPAYSGGKFVSPNDGKGDAPPHDSCFKSSKALLKAVSLGVQMCACGSGRLFAECHEPTAKTRKMKLLSLQSKSGSALPAAPLAAPALCVPSLAKEESRQAVLQAAESKSQEGHLLQEECGNADALGLKHKKKEVKEEEANEALNGFDAIAWQIEQEYAAKMDGIIDMHTSSLDPNLAISIRDTEHLRMPEPEVLEEVKEKEEEEEEEEGEEEDEKEEEDMVEAASILDSLLLDMDFAEGKHWDNTSQESKGFSHGEDWSSAGDATLLKGALTLGLTLGDNGNKEGGSIDNQHHPHRAQNSCKRKAEALKAPDRLSVLACKHLPFPGARTHRAVVLRVYNMLLLRMAYVRKARSTTDRGACAVTGRAVATDKPVRCERELVSHAPCLLSLCLVRAEASPPVCIAGLFSSLKDVASASSSPTMRAHCHAQQSAQCHRNRTHACTRAHRQARARAHIHTHTLSLSLSLSLTHTHTHVRYTHTAFGVVPRQGDAARGLAHARPVRFWRGRVEGAF